MSSYETALSADPEVADLIGQELNRQQTTLQLIASENFTSPAVLAATGSVLSLFPPENATGNYVKIVQRIPVKIVLESGENRDRALRPGMNVEPDVYLQ